MTKKTRKSNNSGTCPDCGHNHAEYTITPSKDGEGKFIRISCPNCNYYEFTFEAKDE